MAIWCVGLAVNIVQGFVMLALYGLQTAKDLPEIYDDISDSSL